MVKILSIFFISLFCSLLSKAQWYVPERVNSKAVNVYNLALVNAQNEIYTVAVQQMNHAIAIEPKFVDAYLSVAGIYANMKNYQLSVQNFEKAFSLDSAYSKFYYLPYSISLAGLGQFKKALDAVNFFLTVPTINDRSIQAANFRKKTYQFAVDYERTHPIKNYVFAPINLGDNINTSGLEYFPSLTIDGQKMIFTKRISGNEDFYETDRTNGGWSAAKPLSGNINTQFNEGAQNISQDGQWLVFTGCNFPQGLGSCDIYISYLSKQGWSEPQNLGANVNSEFWESSPSLSPDKRDLYFSSNVPGGFGGKDIWVCHRNENGKWSVPQNLGGGVNTAGDETCPFIHADNETLYFNSTGLPGYSDKPDIFVIRKSLDNTWTTPENLGWPINTIDDEGSLIVAADGKTAYYASDRNDTKGGLDIYTFQLREDIQPQKTLWVLGKVFDVKTKQGLPSSVELTNVATRQMVSKIQTDEEGNYLTTLPVGKNYAFNVKRKGYLFFSENFSLQNKSLDSTYKLDIPLQPVEVNASIILKNIFFDTKRTDLKPESISELDNVVRFMNENSNVKILISGHTDNVGTPADNLKLSTGRAFSVVNYLISKGVKKERLSAKGLGETKPVTSNKTESDRAINRRTELSIISN
ncbi:hypothetical protein BH09BAC2_BH09BAC2_13400 [soil metagenome]